jgi:cell division protein YceG involved in septum cleavage
MSRIVERIIGTNEYYRLNKKRIWLIGTIVLLVTLLYSAFFITKTVTAQRNTNRIKLVTCVEVEKGDTLWGIASEYISEEYNDMNEYIEEIKNSNSLINDEIHAGNYIIVPYYADASESMLSCQAE